MALKVTEVSFEDPNYESTLILTDLYYIKRFIFKIGETHFNQGPTRNK